jgi:hypothetical protein
MAVVVKILHLFLTSTPDGGDSHPHDTATLGKAGEVGEGARVILQLVSNNIKTACLSWDSNPGPSISTPVTTPTTLSRLYLQ